LAHYLSWRRLFETSEVSIWNWLKLPTRINNSWPKQRPINTVPKTIWVTVDDHHEMRCLISLMFACDNVCIWLILGSEDQSHCRG
jgi:hypothetical protein